jgi:hypothetical protein
MKGQQGLEINDPSKQYTLHSLEGVFSGLQLVSYMFVGFKRIAPGMDVGIGLSEEYEMALHFMTLKDLHEYTLN